MINYVVGTNLNLKHFYIKSVGRLSKNINIMEFEQEEALEPMSPTAQYLKSSVLSLTIMVVLEVEVPIDDSMTIPLLKDVFLPINHRFSSIMVSKKSGGKKWKRVEVNLKDHVIVPVFPCDKSKDYYDECFHEYLSKLGMDQLPLNRPLWEIHIFKYPTKNAAGNVIFKLHHSLGDGYSLMGALLSCLKRLDNPSIPLTFPSRQSNSNSGPNLNSHGYFSRVPEFFSGLINTAYNFGSNLLKSSFIEDDKSPIRSGHDGVEHGPSVITTTTFSIAQIKQIKNKLQVTINDVITGIIMYGTRLYMQRANQDSSKEKCTALVLLSTRAIGGYKSVSEMIKPNAEMPWGNRFTFLHVPIPKLTASELNNPLKLVDKAHQIIKRQRNSASVYLIGQFLEAIRKIRGPEATSGYIYGTLKNSSLAISNMTGPVEKMALANHPIKGLYFAVVGVPQSLQVTILSYVDNLRIVMSVEKGFIDPNKFKSCMEYAFEAIYKAVLE
ncbi:O-acyltransferase WSD1-like [Olea europaea subsp. europaea]|uniref:O-acyltransferase WSD1-like n=1 Tax=Olea europaea subsp. europaea TaxID=158383 RepID=A0A8S0VC17_OLEEU|nr:O-acyltransferase WSD1-like [Olea europaea subsp. europaea]